MQNTIILSKQPDKNSLLTSINKSQYFVFLCALQKNIFYLMSKRRLLVPLFLIQSLRWKAPSVERNGEIYYKNWYVGQTAS